MFRRNKYLRFFLIYLRFNKVYSWSIPWWKVELLQLRVLRKSELDLICYASKRFLSRMYDGPTLFKNVLRPKVSYSISDKGRKSKQNHSMMYPNMFECGAWIIFGTGNWRSYVLSFAPSRKNSVSQPHISGGKKSIICVPGHPKAAFFWSGLKSSERPKIEQLLILPSVSHIWKDQKYDAKWRRKDAKDQHFDTKTVSLNPSLLAQKWFLGLHRKSTKIENYAAQGLSRYRLVWVNYGSTG